MDEKLLFCVSINCVKRKIYGPEWKETDGSKTLIDLFLQVCGTQVLGQQVQVLVSKERSFLEAAVVPVCTSLVVLAEKSQSYIQFILKSENFKLEQYFKGRQKKTLHESGCSLGRHETFCVKTIDPNWSETMKTNYDQTTVQTGNYGGLVTKRSFEDMTVEEICEEIRRIKTTELSRSEFESLNKTKGPNDCKTDKHNKTVPVIKKPVTTSKKSPSPTPTLTSKLRSKSARTKLNKPTFENTLPTKQFKENMTVLSTTRSEVGGSQKPSPDSPTTCKGAVSLTKKSSKKKVPNPERLSILAQPRRRSSDPVKSECLNKIVPTRKSTSPSRKRLSTSNKQKKTRSNFMKPRVDKMAADASEYFVEIFASMRHCNDVTNDKSYDIIEPKDKLRYQEKRPGYSSDSLTHSTEKSGEISVNNVLDELRQISGISPEITKNSAEAAKICEQSQLAISQLISETSTSSAADDDESSSVKMSPQKSPLFSSLLEKNHLKHCSTSNLDNLSFEKQSISVTGDSLEKRKGTKEDSLEESNDFQIDSSASGRQVLTDEKFEEISSVDLGLTCDTPIDSLSLSTSSKNNDFITSTPDNRKMERNIAWSNSRGIIFTGSDAVNNKPTPLNETFVISVKKSEESADEVNRSQSTLDLAIEKQPRAISSPYPVCNLGSIRSPDKHIRKHWDNSLKGMDELLIASLQAFSTELRSTTEHVASNIRTLYETWRKKLDDESDGEDDESTDAGKDFNDTNMQELSKLSSPPNDGSIQKGIAFVFRNLRKIEVKLKTMEQASTTMMEGSVKEKEMLQTQVDEIQQKNETKKSILQRNKSFKWNELKLSARVEARGSTWRRTHPEQGEHDSSSDSDQ